MHHKVQWLVPVLFFLLNPFNVTAGWILTGKYIDKEGNTILQRYFIQDHKVKFEQYNVIYTLNQVTDEMILVDPQNLVYYNSDLKGYISDLKAFKRQQMIHLLASVPPEEKERVENELEMKIDATGRDFPVFGDSISITRVPDSLRIIGQPSEKYLLSSGARKLEELWILPGLDTRSQFSWKSYLRFLSLVDPAIPSLDYMQTRLYLDLLDQGFPGRRIMIVSGYRTEFQLNKLEQKTIPDYEFSIPALCRKVSISGWLNREVKPSNEEDDYE